MPLQNRVDPFGAIFRSPARGTMLGNRGGVLHNDRRQIVRPFLGRRWIACLLQFKGIRRTVMTPGRYTELFFLDEAVAFAAGHRPCAECRRERFVAFRNAWQRRCGARRRGLVLAPEMDDELHHARVNARREKVTYRAALNLLPDGCFVRIDGVAWLVWQDALFLWTPAGYAGRVRRPRRRDVTVLTPRPILECFRAGYRTEVHESMRMLQEN